MFGTFRETLQIFVLAMILCFCFFVLVGAFSPSDVPAMTIAVIVLAVLWAGYAIHMTRQQRRVGGRDELSARQRERRGF